MSQQMEGLEKLVYVGKATTDTVYFHDDCAHHIPQSEKIYTLRQTKSNRQDHTDWYRQVSQRIKSLLLPIIHDSLKKGNHLFSTLAMLCLKVCYNFPEYDTI